MREVVGIKGIGIANLAPLKTNSNAPPGWHKQQAGKWLPRKWRENEKMEREWRENEKMERERKWQDNEKMQR